MKTLIKICSIITTLAIISSLGLKSVDSCNNINFNIPDFDANQLAGMWYPIYRTEHCKMLIDCLSFDVQKSMNSFFLNFIHRRDLNSLSNFRVPLIASQTPNSFLWSHMNKELLFTFVNTDYVNYALVYVCNDTMPRTYTAFILSRTNMLPQEDLTRLMDYTRTTLLIQDKFMPIVQDDLTCSSIVSWRDRDYDY